MKNIGKVAKAAPLAGKDWKKEVFVFLGNYRSTPHTSTGKSPRELMADCAYRSKLPEMPPPQPESREEVERVHAAAKMRQKKYADERRGTAPHSIIPGDSVLVRQPKINKFLTPYNPNPYTVEKVNGSMVTARQGRKSITRNSSAFKNIPLIEYKEPDAATEEPEIDCAPVEPDATINIPQVQDTEPAVPAPNPSPPRHSRSGCTLKVPAWLGDYIVRHIV